MVSIRCQTQCHPNSAVLRLMNILVSNVGQHTKNEETRRRHVVVAEQMCTQSSGAYADFETRLTGSLLAAILSVAL